MKEEQKEKKSEGGSGRSFQRERSFDNTSTRYREATHHAGKHQVRREVDYEDIKTTSTFTACNERLEGGREVGRQGRRGELKREGWREGEEW